MEVSQCGLKTCSDKEISPPKHKGFVALSITSWSIAAEPAKLPLSEKIHPGMEYVVTPMLHYPAASLHVGEEGGVRFRALISIDGKAEKIDIIQTSGFPRLDKEVRRAVKQACFKPYIQDYKPIVAWTTGIIDFKLDQSFPKH